MRIERFEVAGLAQYSYVVSDEGAAVVMDAARDVDRYMRYAEENALRITHVVETHIHADFAAGSVELAQRTGAELALSAYDAGERYEYAMPHRALLNGEGVQVGKLRLEAMHTPGHTPEHISFLLFDGGKSATEPAAMFSGDFVFVGSLGRPDLLGEEAKLGLAQELFKSAHERIAALPDGLMVYPGHGAGSLCGSGMSERKESTLGYERRTNAFFRYDGTEFVERILASVPAMPEYYPRMKELNAKGAVALGSLPEVKALSPGDVARMAAEPSVTLLDVRRPEAFGGAHVAGAVNIGTGQNLSLWAGWLLDSESEIVLIGEEGKEEEVRVALARVGLDRVVGYLDGGMSAWIAEGREFTRTTQRTVAEVAAEAAKGAALILDVRSVGERMAGAIAGSEYVMLGDLRKRMAELPKSRPVIAVCGTGYRSSIAASLLERAGFEDVSSMDGGMGAWERRGMPATA